MRNPQLQFVIMLIISFMLLSVAILVDFDPLLSSKQSQVEFSTYEGGSGNEFATDLILDNNGNVITVGWTDSNNYPGVDHEGFGEEDIFITKRSGSDNSILWTKIYGGESTDYPNSVAIDSENNIYLVGYTYSGDFPTNNYDSLEGWGDRSWDGRIDGFVMKLDENGEIQYSTYFGGSYFDFITSIQIDEFDAVYLLGFTQSVNIPKRLAAPIQNTSRTITTNYDGFISKINKDTSLNWTTFWIGNQLDYFHSSTLYMDELVIMGYTDTQNSQHTTVLRDIKAIKYYTNGSFAWQQELSEWGSIEASETFEKYNFPLNIERTNNDQYYLSYTIHSMGIDSMIGIIDSEGIISENEIKIIGGENDDFITDFVISDDSIIAVGYTNSFGFPIKNGIFQTYSDFGDVFYLFLDLDLQIQASSYLIGNFIDIPSGVINVNSEEIFVVGFTSSSNFLISDVSDSDGSIGGYSDSFFMNLHIEDLGLQSAGGIWENLVNSFTLILEIITIWEVLMFLGIIFFIRSSFRYYRALKIPEYLISGLLVVAMAITSYTKILAYIFGESTSGTFIIFLRQPYLGFTVVWSLILIHAQRIRWGKMLKKIQTIGWSLLIIKLLIIFISLFLIDTTGHVGFSFIILGIISFDLFSMCLLIYSYFTLDLVVIDNRTITSFNLWRIAWLNLIIGYFTIITYTILNLSLTLEAGIDFSDENLLNVYRFLSIITSSGINLFVVFTLILIISVRYPETILLSHIQITQAVELYEAFSTKEVEQTVIQDNVISYLRKAMKHIDQ